MSDLLTTSRRLCDLGVRRATLLVDRARAEANIARFAQRAREAGITLRPHFKTHQSCAVAGWFRKAGVSCATVSSIGMARYFAECGWTDLTLAIPANPLEIEAYDELAGRIELGLTIDSPAACEALLGGLKRAVSLWIEVDTGQGRSGVRWDDHAALIALLDRIRGASAQPEHRFAGLLTHGGQSYAARDPSEAAAIFETVRRRLQAARRALQEGQAAILLSAGDTPGFSAATDWSWLDEARPGNFVFFDMMQLAIGACGEHDLACAVACPVIGVYPGRDEIVVHAGAVHLSRESLPGGGRTLYGRLLGLDSNGFAGLLTGWEVSGLSQEHGTIAARAESAQAELGLLRPGDLVLVAPVHACLTCEQFGGYRTLDGEVLARYRR